MCGRLVPSAPPTLGEHCLEGNVGEVNARTELWVLMFAFLVLLLMNCSVSLPPRLPEGRDAPKEVSIIG